MSYHLVFKEQDSLLIVEASGDRAKGSPEQNAKETWQEITTQCQHRGATRVLILSRVSGEYPTLDAYKVSTLFEQLGVDKRWKLAFVHLDNSPGTGIQFAATVAMNRGFMFQFFTDEKSARKWLSA